MNTLLVATTNKGKLQELTTFLSDLPLNIVSLNDIGITEDIEEDGKTYQENAEKKALFYGKKSGLPTIADDGGLEINALGGEPGVRSRRWLGHEASDEELIEHMKKVAKELPKSNRKAWFRVVVSFAMPDGKVWSAFGEVEGIIAQKPYLKKLKGYPFRSFFYLPQLKKFYHENELTNNEMKEYNHRYKAIEKIIPIIRNALSII